MGKKLTNYRLTYHAWQRMIERVTHESIRDAERYANREIDGSYIRLHRSLDDGSIEISFLCKELKFIVKNDAIVTIYQM